MLLLKRIKRFVASLVLLTFCCLLMEQLVYLALVPGYGWRMLASPVFWGLFSVGCFYLLWQFDKKYPDDFSVPDDNEGCQFQGETNPLTGLPMVGGIDRSVVIYGEDPESGFIKFDNFWLISL